jgi:hypothetical protein
LESEDLLGHRGGELLPPSRARERLVVEQQHRAGGVRLEATPLDPGFEVDHDPLVAESDPKS